MFLLQVPSYTLMGISRGPATSERVLSLTPLGEACTRLDLTAIHEILEKLGYKDDEGIANEVTNLNLFLCYIVPLILL